MFKKFYLAALVGGSLSLASVVTCLAADPGPSFNQPLQMATPGTYKILDTPKESVPPSNPWPAQDGFRPGPAPWMRFIPHPRGWYRHVPPVAYGAGYDRPGPGPIYPGFRDPWRHRYERRRFGPFSPRRWW